MTTPLTAPADSRRRFLGRMGLTLAAGLGLAAVGSAGTPAAAAPKTEQNADSPVPNCAIYCTRTEPCGSCGTGKNRYRCYGPCGTYYACYTKACSSGFCLSQSAC